MANKEYGTRFKIVQIFEGGLRIITNELSLDILKAVMKKQSNITEISKVVKSSKTSVQANINSMVADGILVSCPDPHDNRSIIYGSNCIPMLSSGVGKTMDAPSGKDILRNVSGETDNHRNAMLLFSNELYKHNICIHPMLLDIGSSLGSHIFDSFDLDNGGVLDVLAKAFKVERDYFKDISMGDTLSIRIGHVGETISNLSYLGYLVMGALMYYMFRKDRDMYSREVHLIRVTNCEFILEAKKFGKIETTNEIKPTHERDWKFYRLLGEFTIYHAGSGSTLVILNETMNQILEYLETVDCATVNTVSDALGMKTITAHASMIKMVKLGLVAQVDKSEVRNIRYCINAHTLMVAKNDYAQYVPGNLQDLLDRFLSGSAGIFETIYEIQFILYSCAGIKHDWIISSIASDAAENYFELNKDITAEQFLKDTLDIYFDKKSTLKLESMLPIRFSIECSDENGMRYRDSKIFIETFTKVGLKKITGMEYPVLVDFRQDKTE